MEKRERKGVEEVEVLKVSTILPHRPAKPSHVIPTTARLRRRAKS
jgi:hypothetical protein